MLGELDFRYDIGDVTVSKTRYEPHMYMPYHVHERPYISFVVEGSYTKLRSGGPDFLRRSTLIFHPLGEAHADCVHASNVVTLNFEFARTDLPSTYYAARGPVVDDLCERTLKGLLGHGTDLTYAIQTLLEHVCGALRRATAANVILADAHDSAVKGHRVRSSDLARRLGVHRSAVHRAYVKAYGCPIRRERARARAGAAAELLLQTEALSFAEIALACGYYDQSQFCRQFKDAAGMTPMGFRKRFFS